MSHTTTTPNATSARIEADPMHDFWARLDGRTAIDYPLTQGELLILADHWWRLLVNVETRCTLTGCVVSRDRSCGRAARARLELLEQRLSPNDFARCEALACEEARAALGETHWAAFCEGRAILREETDG